MSHWSAKLERFPTRSLIFYLTVLCKKVCDNVPYTNMCKSSVSIKCSGQEYFSNRFCDLIFLGTLQVHPLFVFPASLWVISVDIALIGVCRSWWDDKWSWVRRRNKCGARRYGSVHHIIQESSKVSIRASSSLGWNRHIIFFYRVPHCGQAFVVGFRCDFWKRTMWEADDHFIW